MPKGKRKITKRVLTRPLCDFFIYKWHFDTATPI